MIRTATPADAGTLARLNRVVQGWHAAAYPDVFYPNPDPALLADHFATRLRDPDVTCFLAGDPAQGYALCSLTFRPQSLFSPAIRRVMVDQIAVTPEVRRQGIGRALLAAARALARSHGCDEVLLDTWEANHAAHAFFRAEGFAPRRMLFRAEP